MVNTPGHDNFPDPSRPIPNGDGSSDSLVLSEGTVQRHVAVQDSGSPLPLMSVGKNMNLKKGTLWGGSPGDASGKNSPPPPVLGVVGYGVVGDSASPRPPSTGGKHGSRELMQQAGAMAPSPSRPKGTGTLCNGAALAGASCASSAPPTISCVSLSLDTPLASRRLVSAAAPIPSIPLPPHQQQATPILRNGSPTFAAPSSSTASPAMRIDPTGSSVPPFPTAEPPGYLRRGGPEELSWLQAQHLEAQKLYAQLGAHLSRVQQESMAMRSSLLAQQHNGGGGEAASPETPHVPDSPGEDEEAEGAGGLTPRTEGASARLVRRGSISGLRAPSLPYHPLVTRGAPMTRGRYDAGASLASRLVDPRRLGASAALDPPTSGSSHPCHALFLFAHP